MRINSKIFGPKVPVPFPVGSDLWTKFSWAYSLLLETLTHKITSTNI
jgi:hypothetical protein